MKKGLVVTKPLCCISRDVDAIYKKGYKRNIFCEKKVAARGTISAFCYRKGTSCAAVLREVTCFMQEL